MENNNSDVDGAGGSRYVAGKTLGGKVDALLVGEAISYKGLAPGHVACCSRSSFLFLSPRNNETNGDQAMNTRFGI